MNYAFQFVSRFFALFLLFSACATAVYSADSSVEFYGARAYAHGGSFYYNTISADFDGDKIPDVATVSVYDVMVFYGDGKGSFAAPRVAFPFPSHELYPVAGDFNGDGRADLVYPARNPADNQTAFAVRFGNTDRTFTAPIYTNQERTALEIVPVDFDRDGKLDLLVPYPEYNNAAIIFYKNNGAGGFTVGGQMTWNNQPGGIKLGDFDGDGLTDFLFGDSQGLKTVKNLGGTFGAPVVVPNSNYPINSTAVGDVNNDGKADIAAVERYPYDPYVTVWIGSGNFTFSEKPDFTVASREDVYIKAIADINGDNRADLVYGSRNRILVSPGRGDGTFETEDSYGDGGGGDVVVTDLNNDKLPDVISNQPIEFNVAGSGSFVVLINQNGILRSAPAIPTGDDAKDIAVGDLNNDGLKDFVVINRGGGGGPGDIIVVRQTRADGFAKSEAQMFAAMPKRGGEAGLDPYSVVIGDFSGDGINDIVVVGHGAYGAAQNALLLVNQNDNEFTPKLFAIGTGDIYSVAAADFNSDGKLDLVTTGYAGVLVSNGVGNGTFAAPVAYFSDVPSSALAVADYNGDSKADIAVVNYTTSKISLLLSGSSGTFTASSTPVISGGISSIAAADMNSDGKTDLVIARESGVGVMINNGGGAFGAELTYQLTTKTAKDLGVADFDGDGKPDVAVTSGSNNITVLLNNGGGALGRETIWGGGAVTAGIVADDLNNDEKPDLIFGYSSSSTGYTKILFNITDASQNAPRPTQFDFDGDGRADAAVFRPSGGVWHLLQSQAGYNAVGFGIATDKIVAADYDGDRRTDIAVFRQGIWHIQRTSLGYTGFQFGTDGDVPVPADYDGDGKADAAVYRQGVWHILGSTSGYAAIQFGNATDKPVPADYDGDGRADAAVYRAGVWHILRSLSGYTAFQFGTATDKPVPADYDGDNRSDAAVYRDGVWYQLLSAGNQFAAFQFGVASDAPAPADYDGDGKADAAVYRRGTWFVSGSASGLSVFNFGLATDYPVANAFVR